MMGGRTIPHSYFAQQSELVEENVSPSLSTFSHCSLSVTHHSRAPPDTSHRHAPPPLPVR
ncbi:hypothetical protein ACS0TY_020199 [Phlomoides rotata]